MVKNLWKSTALYYLVLYCWLNALMNNGFRSLSNFLSFAYPKESKQRKAPRSSSNFSYSQTSLTERGTNTLARSAAMIISSAKANRRAQFGALLAQTLPTWQIITIQITPCATQMRSLPYGKRKAFTKGIN